MKRVILCSLLLLVAPVALPAKVPWGVLGRVDPTATHTAVDDPLTILKKLTSGMPVKVHFTIQDLSTDLGRDNELDSLQLNRRTNRRSTIASQISQAASDNLAHRNEINAFYLRTLQKTADSWFEAATAMINRQGKPEQFPEVLKRLSHQANFQVVAQEDQADLRVLVAKPEMIRQVCSRDDALACVSGQNGESRQLAISAFHINIPEEKLYLQLLLHEFGHVLGLADQYIDFNSHIKYRSTFRGRDGLMGRIANNHALDCDTVDGLINLIDIIYGTEPARKDGWPSLCKDSKDVYANGTVLGSGNYLFVSFVGEPTAQFFTWQQDLGASKPGKVFPFVETDALAIIPDQQVLQKDHLNRPLRAKGPARQDIYYMYSYQNTLRLITKKGKALRLELAIDDPEYMLRTHYFWIPKNRRIGILQMLIVFEKEKGEGASFQLTYSEQKLEDAYSSNVVFSVGYERVKKGRTEYISDGDIPPAPELEKLLSLTADWWDKQTNEDLTPSVQQSNKPSSAQSKTANSPAAKDNSQAEAATQAIKQGLGRRK